MKYWSEESGLAVAGLTAAGEGYLEDNPHLRNPVDWKWVITMGVAALAAVVAMLVACGGSWK